MNAFDNIRFATLALLFSFATMATAEDAPNDAPDDATKVWIAVEALWEAEENSDEDWIDRMLTSNFYGWGRSSPAPRSKSSTQKWDRFADQQGKMVEHELYPLEIVIHENTAIVHYLYSSAFRSKDGKVETSNGRYTDILVRTESGWQFIGWHGGDD